MGAHSVSLFQPLAGYSSGTYEKDVVSVSVMPVSLIFPPRVDLSIWFLVSVTIVSTRDVAMLHSSFNVRNMFGFSACSVFISVAAPELFH